jgi:hypothetical protein
MAAAGEDSPVAEVAEAVASGDLEVEALAAAEQEEAGRAGLGAGSWEHRAMRAKLGEESFGINLLNLFPKYRFSISQQPSSYHPAVRTRIQVFSRLPDDQMQVTLHEVPDEAG